MRKGLIIFFSFIIIASVALGCGNDKPKKIEETKIEESSGEINKNSEGNISKLKYGELLDVNINDKILIIKAKISPSYNNKATIKQNGFNVEDIILNQGGDLFDEIQYWAVADMTNGDESKVISFTLTKDQINAVKNKQLLGNKLVDQANDVWILPSLRD
ncbi:hypothetical protein OEG88_06135 [Clostridium perfringens]|uniref:hypothetical protein n=1 Tax=Clostridium perfringens TaxID=1502 RepID=UPI000D716FBD|nr:hypothetical protein [Clostridium perfringens]EJT5930524.1 hypothetical protein [Clostridium perfringens]EJT6161787.1 hypothetical protein [Clostridium perfringens]EJT6504268.1 hypothetical protein [Clostridium perfringens]MDK0576500.1 hypothetical protein [Clostridium perfringens]MDK0579443.1 hypothetical protein [Clostridium perfringens]